MLLGLRQYIFKNVPLVHFLIDFNTLFHETEMCFATCTNSAPDHDRLWILATYNYCRGALSVHRQTSFYRFGSYGLVEP
ncbi:hypothetical protein TNCV_3710121 [Trichonephila clavipes]|nr:hypothetical protein TNCV_3710121 [Trichonephila clavipes]